MDREKTTPIRRFGLDLIRFTAISMVVASHYFTLLSPLGLFGVELFFVLSGFLIGGILIRTLDESGRLRIHDAWTFLVRRWYRTLPNYYFFFALFYISFSLTTSEPEDGIPLYFLFLQNFAWPQYHFFSVSWSLSIEEWFYLLFASSLLFSSRILSRPTVILTSVIVAFIVLPLLLRIQGAYNGMDDLRRIVIFRLDAIAFGVLMAYFKSISHHVWVNKRTSLSLFFGITSISILSLYFSNAILYAICLTTIPLGFSCLLPLFDNIQKPEKNFGIAGVVVKCVSLWSYSIYLSHMLIYGILQLPLDYDTLATSSKLIHKTVSLAITILVSGITYNFLEKPFINFRDRKNSFILESKLS